MSTADFAALQNIVDEYTDGADVNDQFIRAASDEVVRLQGIADKIAEQLPAGVVAVAPKEQTAAPVTAQVEPTKPTQEAAPVVTAAPAAEKPKFTRAPKPAKPVAKENIDFEDDPDIPMEERRDNAVEGRDMAMESFAAMGLGEIFNYVSAMRTLEKDGVSWSGSALTVAGRYVTVVNTNHATDLGYIEETWRHEFAHVMDMANEGGIYSTHPALAVEVDEGGAVVGTGEVSQQLIALYDQNTKGISAYLNYPLDTEAYPDQADPAVISGELFAQAMALYTKPKGKQFLETYAPAVAQFLAEATTHAQNSGSVRQVNRSEARRRAKQFQHDYDAGTAKKGGAGQRTMAQGTGRRDAGSAVSRQSNSTRRTSFASSLGPVVQQNVARLPPTLRSPVQRILDNIFGAAKRGLYGMAFTHDLADMVAKHIPSVRKYIDLMDQKAAIKADFQKRIDGVLDMVTRLSEVERGTGPLSVNAYLELTNRKGKWGYAPAHLPGLVPDRDVQAAFDRLSGTAQEVVKKVLEIGRDTLMQKQSLVEQAINDEFAERIVAANQAGDPDALNAVIAEQAAVLAKYKKTLALRGDAPYSPFKRYGNYVMVARSQAYVDAVANDDQKWLEANQSDEAHNYVAFYETVGLAKEAQRHFNARGGYAEVSAFAKEDEGGREYLTGGTDMAFAFVRLRNLVKRELPAQDKSTERINRMLSDLHLSMLAETSARRNELERKFIAGHDKDMLRAFATQGRADAHFIAALSRNGDVDKALEAMRAEAKKPTSPADGDKGDRMDAYNEFLRRHANSMDYKETPVQNAMARATSLMFLSTSPAYYLQNLTQTPMISLPYLAGKHGYGRTAAALRQAYVDLAPMLSSVRVDEPMDFSKAPADVQRMVADLLANGRLDNTTAHDLGDFESVEGTKVGSVVAGVDRKMRHMQQKVEAINRVSTAIAAYRLTMQNSTIAPADRHAAAVAYAGRAVMHTHGDYSGFNSPRYFNPNSVPMAKVLFQFKKFQIIQISLLARLVHNSFVGDEKTVARAQLRFILTHMAVMGGAMGLPGMATIGWLFGKLFGDDDEPESFEYKLRKLIDDKTTADLLSNGVPAAFGMNLSGKLGMGNAFSLMPFTDVDLTSRSGAEKTIMGLSGPFIGGLLPKTADGVGKMMDGRYYEGLENLMPTGLGNMLKGARYAVDGVTNSKGEVQLSADDISIAAAFGQTLGLPTTTMSDFRFKQGIQINFEKQLNERSSQIQRDYNRASKSGDSGAKQEAIAAFNKLQAARVSNGFKRQPISTLTSGPADQSKTEKQTVGGLKYNNQNRGFVQQLNTM